MISVTFPREVNTTTRESELQRYTARRALSKKAEVIAGNRASRIRLHVGQRHKPSATSVTERPADDGEETFFHRDSLYGSRLEYQDRVCLAAFPGTPNPRAHPRSSSCFTRPAPPPLLLVPSAPRSERPVLGPPEASA